VSYGCGFGLADGTYNGWEVKVDLDAGAAVQTRIETSREPTVPDPAHSRQTTIAPGDATRLVSLTAAALTRAQWPIESAEMDGIACMLEVHRAGGEALLRVQRQSTDAGDAPAALIEGLGSIVSLGPPPASSAD
jgi:hypothetical protein